MIMQQGLVMFFLGVNLLVGCKANDKGKADLVEREEQTGTTQGDVQMPKIAKFDKEFWINAAPEIVDNLKGKVVVVDFWDYTCINCIRTLPYIKEWNRRYADKGLLIIGVHTPEFEFAKKRENVEKAVKKFELKYPIVLDNEYTIWKIFGNRYWPAKYIFDKNGISRYQHFGEGSYGETETVIQKLLKELDASFKLPPLVEPVRAEDKPGAVCYRPTSETYLGYDRGNIGNVEGYKKKRDVTYTDPEKYRDDTYYLVGRWYNGPESVRLAEGNGGTGSIVISYEAAEANLVIHPEAESGFKVYVQQDGKSIPHESLGEDAKIDGDGRTYLYIDTPRMYNIVKNKKFERHLLRLTLNSNSFGAYAFTFTSMCTEPEK